MNKLHDLLEQGVYDVDTFLDRSASLKQRVKELEEALSKTEKMAERDSTEHIAEQVKRLEAGLSLYDGSSIEEKNHILRSLIDTATYFKAKGSAPSKFSVELTLK